MMKTQFGTISTNSIGINEVKEMVKITNQLSKAHIPQNSKFGRNMHLFSKKIE